MTLTEAIAQLGPVALWKQGDRYLAATLDRGRIHRTTWQSHPTPEAALEALCREVPRPEPSVEVDGRRI